MTREKNHVPAVLLAAALGGTAVANAVLEGTGVKAEFHQRAQDEQAFFEHLGLINKTGEIDREALEKWRRANGLLVQHDGGVEIVNKAKEQEMIREFKYDELKRHAANLPLIDKLN